MVRAQSRQSRIRSAINSEVTRNDRHLLHSNVTESRATYRLAFQLIATSISCSAR